MDQQLLQGLDFIRDQITECGEAPTHEEIRHALFLSSTSQAAQLVDQLVEAGRLVRTRAARRNLALPEPIDLTMAATTAMRAELMRRGAAERRVAPRPARPLKPCAYRSCTDGVPPGFLMCRAHWLELPLRLRTTLVTTSLHGPEAACAAAFERAHIILDKVEKRKTRHDA